MKLRPLLLLAACLALLSLSLVYAATPALYMPIVRDSHQAQPPTVTTLIESDCSSVSAVNIPGTSRILITFIDRAHGNRLTVVEDKGDHVVNVPLPPITLMGAGEVPEFTVPGPKQADGYTLIVGATMHTYFTGRDVDDPTGPFKLKRLSMPVPPPATP